MSGMVPKNNLLKSANYSNEDLIDKAHCLSCGYTGDKAVFIEKAKEYFRNERIEITKLCVCPECSSHGEIVHYLPEMFVRDDK